MGEEILKTMCEDIGFRRTPPRPGTLRLVLWLTFALAVAQLPTKLAAAAIRLPSRAPQAVMKFPTAASPSPIEVQSREGTTHEIHKEKQELLGDSDTAEAHSAPACDLRFWNTYVLFRTISVQYMKACLEAGADPNAQGIGIWTPLHRAARHSKNPGVIEVLVGAGAGPNARDPWEATPLHRAAENNWNPAVTEALLAAGADPNAQDRSNDTLLHYAAGNKNPAVIEALLAAGADANALGRWGDHGFVSGGRE